MNNPIGRYVAVLALLALTGCATIPAGPSVQVLPGSEKSFEQFQADDAVCRQWAGQSISPQEVVNQNTTTGAVVGTALGAGVGALIGVATGHAGTGAAIGAGSGLLLGTASGASAGNASGWEAQKRFDNSYVQCMYAKGNQVPGTTRHYRERRTSPPPPDWGFVPPDYEYYEDFDE